MKGQTGGSLGGGQFLSKRRKDARAAAKKRQEAEWAAKSGPVIVRVGDREVYVKADRVKQDLAAARKALLGDVDDTSGGLPVSK